MIEIYDTKVQTDSDELALTDKTIEARLDKTDYPTATKFDIVFDKAPETLSGMTFTKVVQTDIEGNTIEKTYPWHINWDDAKEQGLTVKSIDNTITVTGLKTIDSKAILDPVVNITSTASRLEDAYVYDGALSTNYGSSTSLYSQLYGASNYITYISFNLSNYSTSPWIVKDAMLYLYQASSAITPKVYKANCTPGWESQITYADRNTWCSAESTEQTSWPSATGYSSLNITTYINNTGQGAIKLQPDIPFSDKNTMYSSEHGTYPMYLTITFDTTTDPLNLADGSTILFVDKENLACSNTYTRAQALNPATPWCSHRGFMNTTWEQGKLQCGDTVYFKNGSYNDASKLYMIMPSGCTANTTIASYPGDEVWITNYVESIANNTVTWYNVSSKFAGQNVWARNQSSMEQDDSQFWTDPYTKLVTNKCLGSATNCSSSVLSSSVGMFLNRTDRTFSQGYADKDNKVMYVKLQAGENPNTMPIYFSHPYTAIELNGYAGSGNFIIENLNFRYARLPLFIKRSNNVIFRNNNILGGKNGVLSDGESARGINITIQNNTFNGLWQFNSGWMQQLVKQTWEEGDAIYIKNGYGPHIVNSNKVYNWSGGISTTNVDASNEMCNDRYYDNQFYNGTSSQFELEDRGCNSTIYNNSILGGWGGISLGPYYCAPATPCKIFNNQVYLNSLMYYNETVSYLTYPLKTYNDEPSSKLNVSYINVSNNYFSGGRAWYYILPEYPNTQRYMDIYNNIFIGRNGVTIFGTGLYSLGNNWDYNYYIRSNTSSSMFTYYNNESTSGGYASLAAVMALGWHPASWNVNSQDSGIVYNSTPAEGGQYAAIDWNSSTIDAGTDLPFRSTDMQNNPIYGAPDIGPWEYQPPYTLTNLIYNASVRVYSDGKYRLLTAGTQLLNFTLAPISGWGMHTSSQPRPQFADVAGAFQNNTVTAYNLTLTEPTNITLQIWHNATRAKVYINNTYTNKTILLNGTGWGTYSSNGSSGNYTFTPYNIAKFDGATNITSFYMDNYLINTTRTGFEIFKQNRTLFHIRNYENYTESLQVNFTFDTYNYTCQDFTRLEYVSHTGAYTYTLFDGDADISCVNATNIIIVNLTGIEPASGSNNITIYFTPLGVAIISGDPMYETEKTEFGIYMNHVLYNISYVMFIHNGTEYETDMTYISPYDWYNVSVYAPIIGESAFATVFYYWNIYYLNGSTEQTHVYNYTVVPIWFDNCSRSTNETIKYNIYDENNPETRLNADIELIANYYYDDRGLMKNFSFNHTGLNNYSLCIYPDNISMYLDSYLRYNTSGGFIHRHYLSNETISYNSTNHSVYNVIDTTGYSTLVLTVRDKNTYMYFDDAIVSLQKYYVGENVWRTVQMGYTGAYGNLPYNIIEKDEDYRFLMYDTHSHLLETSDNLQFTCTGGNCDLTYLILPYSSLTSLNITVWHTYDNNTGIVRAFWKGNINNQTLNVKVTKQAGTKTTTVCNTNISTVFGQSICDISAEEGTYSVAVSAYDSGKLVGEYFAYITRPRVEFGDLISESEAAFWSIGFMLVIASFGLFSPAAAIISTFVGVVVLFYIGLLTGVTFFALIGIGIIAFVVSLKIRN